MEEGILRKMEEMQTPPPPAQPSKFTRFRFIATALVLLILLLPLLFFTPNYRTEIATSTDTESLSEKPLIIDSETLAPTNSTSKTEVHSTIDLTPAPSNTASENQGIDFKADLIPSGIATNNRASCLLYTSDAADE